MDKEIKPPIGVTPRSIHDHMRMHHLAQGIARFLDPKTENANIPYSLVWIEELSELVTRYADNAKKEWDDIRDE